MFSSTEPSLYGSEAQGAGDFPYRIQNLLTAENQRCRKGSPSKNAFLVDLKRHVKVKVKMYF